MATNARFPIKKIEKRAADLGERGAFVPGDVHEHRLAHRLPRRELALGSVGVEGAITGHGQVDLHRDESYPGCVPIFEDLIEAHALPAHDQLLRRVVRKHRKGCTLWETMSNLLPHEAIFSWAVSKKSVLMT